MHRRLFLTSLLGASAAVAGLDGCAKGVATADTGGAAATRPLAAKVPAGTSLKITSYQGVEQLQFRLGKFPPIQAQFQGLAAKIVAIELTRRPNYLFATRPGSDIRTVADFKHKRLAFSQGQAQGVVLLRALKKAGLAYGDAELVPLTSNQFLTALQSGQVDVAPLANSQAPAYLKQYAAKGARTVATDVVDLLNLLWAPQAALNDPAKAAAIAAYIPQWARGQVWQYEHPDQWNEEFYVKTQNLTLPQAKSITALANKPLFPPNWDEAIKWEQETADLLAEGGFVKRTDVSGLFDHRFEAIAARAVPEEYRR
ncbi:ABC transporter substrate-binding protein [Streptomyces murinus]